MIPKASEDLHAYQAWRKSLTALPLGTIVKWNDQYLGSNAQTSIKVGQMFKIMAVNESVFGQKKSDRAQWAGKVYTMIQCNAAGKVFKKQINWNVEGIARWLDEGKAVILSNGDDNDE